MTFGNTCSGSIVGITPGIALSTSGGGSIVGITPGRSFQNVCIYVHISIIFAFFLSGGALEKKSVRELAAGLNRMGKLFTMHAHE